MVDAVLLEWEGVLADTSVARRDAMTHALGAEGVHLDEHDVAECCDGMDLVSAAHAAVIRAGRNDVVLADMVALRARRVFAKRLGKGLTLKPGAHDFAERLCLGARTAVVTCASRSETEFVLRLAGLDGVVATIVAVGDQEDLASVAARFSNAMQQLARVRPVRADHVVALVSSQHGIHAARAAGVHVVAVGVEPHVAVEADGVLASIESVSLNEIARVAGIAGVEQRP
jgi:beta-phosphoglucomutase-like phosphatase (HAD superfamily)